MNNIKKYISIALATLFSFSLNACDETEKKSPNGATLYNWEAERNALLDTDDLVLIYAGGEHRKDKRDKSMMQSYVSYTNKEGKEQWLFDSFLFLEIFDTVNKKIFATGYNGNPAKQADWKKVLDYYFSEGNAICAVEDAIEETKGRIGSAAKKHKIVVSIPEPISSVSDWGEIDGKKIDLTAGDEQRMEAVKWYVDYVRQCFNKKAFKNIELAGFYWVAEETTHTRSIISTVANYLNDLKYSFNWIPYFNADGYSEWKEVSFNYAYLQPNYYFNDKLEFSRLDEACKIAIANDMDMEIEFDETATVAGGDRGYRLRDYMRAFREHKIIEGKKLAYYQGNVALHHLRISQNEADQALYHDFCQFVLEHQKFINQK